MNSETNAYDISIKSVSVRYRNNHLALDDVSLSIKPQRICGLVGVNGAGKSTLFKTIMGFIKPQSGTISIGELSVHQALKNNVVAYVPQSEEVDWNFPVLVKDVVMMGRYGHMGFLRRATAQDKDKVNEALARVNLTEYADRQIGNLSGGQRKRVFVARALAQESKVILLDEPFTGVDIKTEASLVQLFRQLADEGCLILVSTHNLGSVPSFCDDVILINQQVLAYGSVEKTFTQENLTKAFGGMLRHLQLSGADLHDDNDSREVTVLTDDERPLVLYGEVDGQKIIPDKERGND